MYASKFAQWKSLQNALNKCFMYRYVPQQEHAGL